MSVDYAALDLVQALPDYFHPPSEDETVFRRLAGARVVKIRTPRGLVGREASIEGGGLIIDYELEAEDHRLVLVF